MIKVDTRVSVLVNMQAIETLLHNPRRQRIKLIERGPPNPAHYYTIDGSSEGVISTTALLKPTMPPFDAELQIATMMASPAWPKNKLYGLTPEEIKREWSTAAPAGTAMHHNFENYHAGQPYNASAPEFVAYAGWLRQNPHIEHVASEYVLGSKAALLGGAIDNLSHDTQTNTFLMFDYKRTTKLRTQGYCECHNPFGLKKAFPHQRTINFAPGHDPDTCRAFGTHPLTEHLPSCNHITYSLQQHVYGHLLEHPNLYNFPLAGQYLLAITPPTYYLYQAPVADVRSVARELIAERVREVKATL